MVGWREKCRKVSFLLCPLVTFLADYYITAKPSTGRNVAVEATGKDESTKFELVLDVR